MYFLSDFFQFLAKSSMYGAKLNISCTDLMDGSPNYASHNPPSDLRKQDGGVSLYAVSCYGFEKPTG